MKALLFSVLTLLISAQVCFAEEGTRNDSVETAPIGTIREIR